MNFQPLIFNIQWLRWRFVAAWLVAMVFVGDSRVGYAQQRSSGMAGVGTTMTRYYPAPNFKQMELKLTGDEIAPLANDPKRIRAKKPEFWAYQENGEVMITLRTPECVLDETDTKARRLNSTEQLTVVTGDRRFQLQGRGFLWEHNQRLLTISNDVRALVYWTNDAPPLVITSRWFQFNAESRRGVFHEDVRAEDTNQVLTCAWLTVVGSTNKNQPTTLGLTNMGRGGLELIEADGGMEVTGISRPGHARGRR